MQPIHGNDGHEEIEECIQDIDANDEDQVLKASNKKQNIHAKPNIAIPLLINITYASHITVASYGEDNSLFELV